MNENMNTPIVSIIVPCYNVEKYLEKCLESVINQTYNNIEIVLINDGSSDNSLKIMILIMPNKHVLKNQVK